MYPVSSTVSAVVFSLAACAYAAIGPSSNMRIVNANISPDGFERASVTCATFEFELTGTWVVLFWLAVPSLVHSFGETRLDTYISPP